MIDEMDTHQPLLPGLLRSLKPVGGIEVKKNQTTTSPVIMYLPSLLKLDPEPTLI